MFVSVRFTVKRLPDCSSLELITVTLHCNNHKSCLSLFYRPPCVSVDVLSVLQNYYELINISQFSSFIVIGDFNINILDSSHPIFYSYSHFYLFLV